MSQSQQGLKFITYRSLFDHHKQKCHLPTDILSMSGDRHLQMQHRSNLGLVLIKKTSNLIFDFYSDFGNLELAGSLNKLPKILANKPTPVR